MAATEQDGSQQQKQQQLPEKSPTSPYVFKDPRLGWAESPQGGMTNVQGPPLEKVKQHVEQMWPVQQPQESQGWPEPPQVQEGQGWPQPGQAPAQQQQQDATGWPQPQQPQDSPGWPQPPGQQRQEEGTGGWPQPQQTQKQQPDASRWPQPEHAQPQQSQQQGWPEPQQAQSQQKAQTQQSETAGWPQPPQQEQEQQQQQQQQDTAGWPQPQGQDTQGWPQPQAESKSWPQPPLEQQAQKESPQRKPYWEQPTQEQVQEHQKQVQQADVRPVPGGWPQPLQQHEQEASVPGGWPQPPSLNAAPAQAQAQSYVEVRPGAPQPPIQVPQQTPQQQIGTPAPTVTPASSHMQDLSEEPDPLDNLEKFYEDSIRRFIDMIQDEVAATTDEDKLKVFTEFMEKEYFVRGQRYPHALGGPPSGRNSVFGKLPGGLGTAEKVKDDKLGLVVEVGSRPAEPQQLKPPTPVAPPAEIFMAPSGIAEVGGWPSPEHRAMSPTSFPEVVSQNQGPMTPKPSTRSPEPPISPEPLVINKRSSAYQPFRPGAVPTSPPGSISPGSFAPGVHENQYLPFQPPGTSKTTPEPNQGDVPSYYKPYNPIATGQATGRGSPIPIGPERGSQYVPYDPKRASVIMSGTPAPAPGKTHLKRDSAVSAYPPPARADTIPTSPTSGGPHHPFSPLKSSKTLVDGYSPYVPSSGYPSSTGSSNVFSTPESETLGSKKMESYFPTAPPVVEPLQPIKPLQTRRAPPPVPEELKNLLAVLPEDRAPRVESTRVLDEVKKTIETIGEDFNFIGEINRAYTESAKKRRRGLDEGRRKRAEEHEEYTDELFADEQIGYGDIKDMETEFKSQEARKEAKEEEDEYETYCSEVFQKVYDKLQEGIKGLMDKYLSIVRDIPTAVVGKERWNTPAGVELTELLEGLLELRKYIETRHEKVQEAIIDRDRRFKKTVIQPLYASGNIGKMKSMEKHFDESEKKT